MDDMIQIEIPDLEVQPSAPPPAASASQAYAIPSRQKRNSEEKPAEYALHILFTQFVRHTERSLNMLSADEKSFDVAAAFGEGVDPQFDKILASLGHVASRKPKPVIDSVMYWRKSKSDQASQLQSGGSGGAQELQLAEQKSLVSIYILSRVLIEVVKQAPPEVLGTELYEKLEDIVFKQLQSGEPLLISRSPIRHANWSLLSKLLGDMSAANFSSVEDRFICELEKVPKTLSRQQELKTELLIQAMEHLKLVLYPEDRLEESANFLSSIAKFYNGTNSASIKDKYSQVLSKMFEPIAAVATAEMNHPLWANNITHLYRDSLVHMKRNWHVSFELAVMSLCVAPQEFFIEHFLGLLESQLAPPKQKINVKWAPRYNTIYQCSAKLTWVYCFRCIESFNATTRKIETIKKLIFSPPKKFWPLFDQPAQAACISMLCSLFHSYQQYTLDEILFPMLTGLDATSVTKNPLISMDNIVPERAFIAVAAFTRCLHYLTHKSNPDFPSSEWISEYQPLKYAKPSQDCTISASLNASIDLFGNCLGQMLTLLSAQLEATAGQDESPSSRQNSVTYFVGLTKSTHSSTLPKIGEELAVSIIQSMPYWAAANSKYWELLCRQINHVQQPLSRAATSALRHLAQSCDLKTLVGVHSKYLFSVDAKIFSSYKNPTISRFDRTLRVYIDLIEIWVKRLESRDPGFTEKSGDMTLSALWSAVEDIEGNGLFLLCSQDRSIRQLALRILWLSTELDRAIEAHSRGVGDELPGSVSVSAQASSQGPQGETGPADEGRLIHFLEHAEVNSLVKRAALDLSMPERTRLQKFKSKKGITIARLADSDYGVDSAIWLKLFPLIIAMCFEKYPMPMALCRSTVCARLVQMHDVIFEIIENEDSAQGGQASYLRHPMHTHPELVVEQWRIYLIVACTTLTTTEEQKLYVPYAEPSSSAAQTHNRKKSSGGQRITLHHQRITSARSVFKICLPLLGVANANICDAVITGLSCVNVNTYYTLLQCIHPFLIRWGALCQSQAGVNTQNPRRTVTHCTQILASTSHLLGVPPIKSDTKVMSELQSIFDCLFQVLSIQQMHFDTSCQQLPRYFCELLTAACDSLGPQLFANEADRFWGLIERWSSYGSHSGAAADREALLRRAVLGQTKGIQDQNIILASLEFDKRKSDYSINKAMATFIGGPCSDAKLNALLDWIHALLNSSQDSLHEVGRLAIKRLVAHNSASTKLVRELIYRSYYSTNEEGTRSISRHYFIALVGCFTDDPSLLLVDPEELLALGLFQIGSTDSLIRQRALDLISMVEKRAYGKDDFNHYQIRIRSRTPPVFKREIFRISAHLAASLPEATFKIFSCLTKAFHDVSDASRRDILSAILPWIQNIEFTQPIKQAAKTRIHFPLDDASALMVLCNLFELTVTFSGTIQHEIEALWVALCTGQHSQTNVDVVMEFLFHLCLVSRSTGVIIYARRILLFLSGSVVERYIVENLLEYLEPQWLISQTPRALTSNEATETFPYVADPTTFVNACDDSLALVHNQLPQLSYGHLAVIFLVDLTENKELLATHLARILHVCLVLFDYFVPVLQEKAVELCLHMLAMFVEKPRNETTQILKNLAPLKWYYDDMNLTSRSAGNVTTPENMVKLIKEIIAELGPDVQLQWSLEAIKWATTCPIRHIACRSFQIFRCLLTEINNTMLADMLARLSTTISEDAPDIQGFSIQILMSINAIVDKTHALGSYPQLFWTAAASMGTTREREYIECLSITSKILDKWDWQREEAIDYLRSSFPPRWEGEFGGLLNLVLLGLRSNNSYDASLGIIAKMCTIPPNEILFDQHYMGLMFAAFLPSFLHATEAQDTSRVHSYAVALEDLATVHGLDPFKRILHSLIRNRFRSKQDFLNQYVNALCQLFPNDLTDVLITLMGTLNNKLEWVKLEALSVLKLLLSSINLQEDERLNGLGADVVSPLLRLLQTDLVEQALEVLDQASTIVAGQMDKQILRMSLGSKQLIKEYERTATLFGIPEESGWSVPKPAITANVTRNNVHSVFYTCNNAHDSTENVETVKFEGEESYDYNDYSESTLQRADSLSTTHEAGPHTMDRMLTALDDFDSFFTDPNRKTIRAHPLHPRNLHQHQLSVGSSIHQTKVNGPHSRKPSGMSGITESSFNSEFVDRNESISIPQLYDKKVSLILNHSLGPDQSSVSFRTSFADPFHHNILKNITGHRIGNILENPSLQPSTSSSSINTVADSSSDFFDPSLEIQRSAQSSTSSQAPDSSFRLESLLRGKRRSKRASKKEGSSFQFP